MTWHDMSIDNNNKRSSIPVHCRLYCLHHSFTDIWVRFFRRILSCSPVMGAWAILESCTCGLLQFHVSWVYRTFFSKYFNTWFRYAPVFFFIAVRGMREYHREIYKLRIFMRLANLFGWKVSIYHLFASNEQSFSASVQRFGYWKSDKVWGNASVFWRSSKSMGIEMPLVNFYTIKNMNRRRIPSISFLFCLLLFIFFLSYSNFLNENGCFIW